MVSEGPGGALLCVWGTSADAVYVVGGDPGWGTGPAAHRLDRGAWVPVDTDGMAGTLWWVFGPEERFKEGTRSTGRKPDPRKGIPGVLEATCNVTERSTLWQ